MAEKETFWDSIRTSAERWWTIVASIGEFGGFILALGEGWKGAALVLGFLFIATMIAAIIILYRKGSELHGNNKELKKLLAAKQSPEFLATARYFINSVEQRMRSGLFQAFDFVARISDLKSFTESELHVIDLESAADGRFIVARIETDQQRAFVDSDRFYLQKLSDNDRASLVAELSFRNYGTSSEVGFFKIEAVKDAEAIESVERLQGAFRQQAAGAFRVTPVFDVGALVGLRLDDVKTALETIFRGLPEFSPHEVKE